MPNWISPGDFNGYEALNMRLQNLSVPPSVPAGVAGAGRIYFATAVGTYKPTWRDEANHWNEIPRFCIYPNVDGLGVGALAAGFGVLRNAAAKVEGDITGNSATSTKWAAPIAIGITGGVVGSSTIDGSGAVSIATTISDGYVGISKLAPIAKLTLLGRLTASPDPGPVEVLTIANVRALGIYTGGTGVAVNVTTGAISIGQDVATTASPQFANLTLAGNLTVNGTTTTVNSTTTTIVDPIMTLGAGVGGGLPITNDGNDRGFELLWHNGSVGKRAFLGMLDSTKHLVFTTDATITNENLVAGYTLGTIDAKIEWANVLTKPSPQIEITLDGAVEGVGTATLSGLANGSVTIMTTIPSQGPATLGNIAANTVLGNKSESLGPVSAIKIRHEQDVTGPSNSVTVLHNLDSKYVMVQCFDKSNGRKSDPDYYCTNNNEVQVVFGDAPNTLGKTYTIVCWAM